MDLTIHFRDDEKNIVTPRYSTSCFSDYTTANNLIQAFQEDIPVNLQKKTHLSTDGWAKCQY